MNYQLRSSGLATALAMAMFASLLLSCHLAAQEPEPVSFARQIRPLLAENCFGCHQGARQEGKYVMTNFDSLMTGGHSGVEAVVPGDPDESYLIELVTSHDGKAAMPPNASPLSSEDVELIRRWISEGASNDYSGATVSYSNEDPPPYSRQPNITAIDYSPDGKWLAMNGFHEILLFDTGNLANAKIARRFVGLSARIESVRFSPDGKRLAASGGNPAEFGEVQIWDVETGKLQLSKIVSHDTVYGINWSPDGNSVSFGCTDTTVRVIDAQNGKQLLYQGAHEDWIRDTVFSVDGSQLVSVGRDMTCKLYEVATQRFIDNITSITPGVLKGGIGSVARHPVRDEVVIGGADGIPKVYRMNRITKRVIGDDANLVRLLPGMPGRIQSVAVSRDGKRIAAVSSLNGKGTLHVYSYEFDPTVSDELKAILAKLPGQWSQKEREKVQSYNTAGVKTIASAKVENSGLYSVQFHPDGTQVATAGADGTVRVYETESGKLESEFQPVAISTVADAAQAIHLNFKTPPKEKRPKPEGKIIGLKVSPQKIEFTSPTDYSQLVVQAVLNDGSEFGDVTEHVNITTDFSLIDIHGSLVQPKSDGQTELLIELDGHSTTVPVLVALPGDWYPGFRRDVNPILTRLGCNAGTCHGSADGKMGFKLSLRGYDPIFDLRAFTDDMGSRRTNLAAPADSLMLAKPSAIVPHSGGKLLDVDDRYYQIIREWIRNGAVLDHDAPRVVKVELFPANPILGGNGASQQMRLVATMSDGTTRDVTREGVIEVGGMETARIENDSVVVALRRGETPILGRYEGAFTATTLTVMGKRDGFVWQEPETWGEIDRLVSEKWKRVKIQPSDLCTDDEFIRRIYLDLTGLPPTSDQVLKFVADQRPTREKRDELIDELIGSDSFVEHWSNKWADLLQVNRKYLGPDGAKAFRDWIREQVRNNRHYDEFAYDILTATGSNRENPAAAYFKIHRTPVDTMENTTHLFLATRFNCNKCHDHPFERWTQDQYFETAAWFAQVSLKRDPSSGDMRIGGSAVEGAKPLYEIIADADAGEIKHDRTGEQVEPKFPFDCDYEVNPNAPRRARFASWITSADNPYFATSYVNRLWGYMLGIGLIEPLDDLRAGNPPSNPQLLEFLRSEFIQHDFDMQHVLRLICKSRTYQLSIETNAFNNDDQVNYSHAIARRLPAEVLFDSIHFVTGSELKIPGVQPGTRAATLPDAGVKLPSGFLSTLGRPARESVCECERGSDLQLGSILALVSGPDVARAIEDPESELAQLVASETNDRKLISEIFLRILNRPATDEEIDIALSAFGELSNDHQSLVTDRDERQKFVDERRPGLEKQRLDAISTATSELDTTITELDPDLLKKEAAREKAIADTRAALDQYIASPQGLTAWMERQANQVHWHPLNVSQLQSTIDRPWSVLEDRSVLLENKRGKDIYTVTSRTDLTGVTAIRLELLPHSSHVAKGPGISDNGNLVLTEFQLEFAHPDTPEAWKPVEFESAIANFEQNGFPVTNAVNGKIGDRGGWALHGSAGKTSWATFQLKIPMGYNEGTLLRFKLHQQFDEQHQVGRFRISLTRNHGVGLGLSEPLLAELAKPEGKRSPETGNQLTAAFRKSDSRFGELETAHNKARTPLMINPEIIRLREKLQRVSRPVPEDSTLVQLIRDAEFSEKQLANARLTASQDLAWALINSPSFLFNR